MNTIKNNFENQIRKQIEEREINPSRDLWSEIQNHTQNNRPKSKLNWLLVAACLILLFSLGSVLVFYNKQKPSEVQITEGKTSSGAKKVIREVVKESPAMVLQDVKKKDETKNTEPSENLGAPEAVVSRDNKKLPVIKENTSELVPVIIETPPAKIIAQTDSAKVPAGRKRYVDPSTLLFSVEHKDAIEKTKGKSNVATIDLNGK
ncbi:hypothetical protein AAEU33_05955 [Chryseobacterium sp. Chry.R1]|uniref:hypothetical protein n=1 Tax=Chryseobacterium sp. Chry.R1 TaxID=3139392 RepID=UPI0031F9BDD8